MHNKHSNNSEPLVVISASVTFPSKVYPGVKFVVNRMTAGRRVQLERSMLPYTEKVVNMYIDSQKKLDKEKAELKKTAAKGKISANDNLIELSLANSAVDINADKDEAEATSNSNSDSNNLGKPQDNAEWNEVARRRHLDSTQAAMAIEELRPIYLKVYLKKVINLSIQVEGDDEDEIIPVVTADDVLKYATDDFIAEIFDCIYHSKEPGMALNELELKNLQLPITLPQSEDGATNVGESSTATGASV